MGFSSLKLSQESATTFIRPSVILKKKIQWLFTTHEWLSEKC